MKEFYVNTRFYAQSLVMIETINSILDEYNEQNLKLTVRQLYYQLVARDYIPNTVKAYKKIIETVVNGRLAGLIDWDMIQDRTREFVTRSHWTDPKQLVSAAARQFHMDMWVGQNMRPVIIIEKEALVGVFETVAHMYDVPLMAARGYPSVSVLREFAERIVGIADGGQLIRVLHFGDHDPSGIDMTRDLLDRLRLLSRNTEFELERLALNMDQVRSKKPPPNPAKMTDSRFRSYKAKFGTTSWELDALQPNYLYELAEKEILDCIDADIWAAREREIELGKRKILKALKTMK